MSVNQEYFKSYEDIDVHELMLKDVPRNKRYREAIESIDLKDKVVLDIGCGPSCFLALLAARAGAKKVYAVEASAMAMFATNVVQDNGFEDVIQVIHEDIEKVNLEEKVDVIVSEWMGFYLLHESMLNSVLVAREK